MTPNAPSSIPESRSWRVHVPLSLLVGLLAWLFLIARWLWQLHPAFELTTHTTWHVTMALSVAIALLGWARWRARRRSARSSPSTEVGASASPPAYRSWLLGAWLLIPWGVCLWIAQPWMSLPVRASTRPAGSLTIFAWNLLVANDNHDVIVETIRQSDADVVILAEVNPFHRLALQQLESEYPYSHWQTRLNTRGIAMLSRVPHTQFADHQFGASRMAAVEARLLSHGNQGPMSVLGIHTASPNLEGRSAVRDDELQAITAWAREREAREPDRPLVIAGDYNITPWSPPFRTLLQETGLRDSREFFGYLASWPSDLGIFGIPIDHALVSRTLRVTDRAAGFPSRDSDHGWIRVTVTSASKQ